MGKKPTKAESTRQRRAEFVKGFFGHVQEQNAKAEQPDAELARTLGLMQGLLGIVYADRPRTRKQKAVKKTTPG